MSWLTTIEKDILALVGSANADPAVHTAAQNTATSLQALGATLANIAETGVEDLISAKLGPAAGALEYALYEQLVAYCQGKMNSMAATTPAPAGLAPAAA